MRRNSRLNDPTFDTRNFNQAYGRTLVQITQVRFKLATLTDIDKLITKMH